jgi:hypothetical protein
MTLCLRCLALASGLVPLVLHGHPLVFLARGVPAYSCYAMPPLARARFSMLKHAWLLRSVHKRSYGCNRECSRHRQPPLLAPGEVGQVHICYLRGVGRKYVTFARWAIAAQSPHPSVPGHDHKYATTKFLMSPIFPTQHRVRLFGLLHEHHYAGWSLAARSWMDDNRNCTMHKNATVYLAIYECLSILSVLFYLSRFSLKIN